jgi:hypothetical protein
MSLLSETFNASVFDDNQQRRFVTKDAPDHESLKERHFATTSSPSPSPKKRLATPRDENDPPMSPQNKRITYFKSPAGL